MTDQLPVLLVVEDDEGLQRQLKWAYEGYEVVLAGDRASALEALRLHEPTVVTLDLGLPPDPDGTTASARMVLLVGHLAFGSLAYVAGYLAVPTGRGDLAALVGWLRCRLASAPPADAAPATPPFRSDGEGLD
jgi:hypothetical protein